MARALESPTVVRSIAISEQDAEQLRQFAQRADRSSAAEARVAIREHIAQAERDRV